MTLKAIIVDDELNARLALRGVLEENFPEINVVGECSDEPSAVQAIYQLFQPPFLKSLQKFVFTFMPRKSRIVSASRYPNIFEQRNIFLRRLVCGNPYLLSEKVKERMKPKIVFQSFFT
jgi:hypothetical protein